MFKHSHAARFFLPLVMLLGGTAHAQLTNRPTSPSPASKPPAITQPASEMKVAAKLLDSAPQAQMEKAFRLVIGRDPVVRGELQNATKFILKGQNFYCIPPSDIAEFDPPPKIKRTEWDCNGAITGWLYETPEGQKEYAAVYARAAQEVFGLDLTNALLKAKPQDHPFFGRSNYSKLVEGFTNRLYGKSPIDSPAKNPWVEEMEKKAEEWAKSMWSDEEKAKAKAEAEAAAKEPLSLESTVKRAFLQGLKRKPTEADLKAVIPVFQKEMAKFSRMVEILQGLDSLKNIK